MTSVLRKWEIENQSLKVILGDVASSRIAWDKLVCLKKQK